MPPVVLIAGDDDLLLQRALERWLGEATADGPELTVDVRDVSETEHLPEMRTASLFGGRTCVVLRGVEGVTGALKEELESYLDAPDDDAVLVLLARGVGKIPKIAKLAVQRGERIDVKTPADWDDGAWERLVRDELRRLGREADPSAVAAIRAHAGAAPATIASQVASVSATAPAGATLTADHVDAVVEGHGRSSGFAVADAVAERDVEAALVALKGALDAGEAPLAIMGALAFRLRQLLQVRAGATAAQAGMSPGQHRRTQRLAAGFGPGELAWCHARLAELDVDLKGSDLPGDLLVELAVVELATPGGASAPTVLR